MTANPILRDFRAATESLPETAPRDPNLLRAEALGTAFGEITYAMLCLREGRSEHALETLERGKAAILEACPHLTDFWQGREVIGNADALAMAALMLEARDV